MVMRSNRIQRKLLWAATLVTLLIGLAGMYGCRGADGALVLFATPTPSPSPTPTPIPTPTPVVALIGGEDAPEYAKLVEQNVLQAGLAFEAIPGGPEALDAFSPKGAAGVIVFCKDALPDVMELVSPYPLFFCLASRQSVPQGVSNLCYDGDMAPAEALQLALDYPPHLAPVRMLGLFANEDSPAADIWEKAVEDGLILDRGAFVLKQQEPKESSEKIDQKELDPNKIDQEQENTVEVQVNQWLTAAMKRLYPGMLDCVYAETGELAVAAANTLLALGRTDAEIFSAGADGDVRAYLDQHPSIVANAVGMDVEEAARISAESVIELLNGKPLVERSLTPQVFPETTPTPTPEVAP